MSVADASLSVIMPCRNGEPWLADALASVCAQTVRPMEIILVDDGSTDRSADIARSFGATVRVVANRGRGSNAARRTGVLEARGTFVALCDSDDLIEPTKHERQLAILESSDPFTIVHTGSVAFWDDDSRPPVVRSGTETAIGRCTQTIFESNPVCGASVMFRRQTVLDLGNYDPEMFTSGDYLLWMVASVRCDFVCVPEPLYRMRRHARNLTNRVCLKTWYHWLAQEKFRRCCPEAFAQLPAECVERCMRQPVLRAISEAYWRRDARDYGRLLRLARQLAPEDPQIRTLWRRRWWPMSALLIWDRLAVRPRVACVEGQS